MKKQHIFFRNLLCHIFCTDYSDIRYKYPDFKPNNEVGIYDILFAFLDCVRKSTDEKHYKEKLRKAFAGMNAQMKENLPALYLLNDNTYSLSPSCKTKKEKVVRNKSRRATYRNFNDEKHKFLNVNIYGLMKSKYISVSKGKITFLIEEKLPDCKLIDIDNMNILISCIQRNPENIFCGLFLYSFLKSLCKKCFFRGKRENLNTDFRKGVQIFCAENFLCQGRLRT